VDDVKTGVDYNRIIVAYSLMWGGHQDVEPASYIPRSLQLFTN
jgi:hypothetical protein